MKLNLLKKLPFHDFSFAITLFLILNILDVTTTYYALYLLHGQELNPIIDWLLQIDPVLLIVVKLIMFLIVTAYTYASQRCKLANTGSVLTGGVVIWNLFVILVVA